MIIKRINAYLSIIITVLLAVHVGYECTAFIFMYYNPLLSQMTGYLIAGTVVVHAALSAACLFVLHDSGTVTYIRLNIKTVIQRICALVMILLLPVHIFAFDLLGRSVGSFEYVLTEAVQVLFYAAVFAHIAVSFEKSLVTLGRLEKETTRRRLNIILAAVCIILFIVTCVITITTHLKIFYG